MTVTIREVARRAGVAVSTASRALSGGGPVGEATAERVHAAATALGYEPNRWAASLRGGATKRIAMIVPDLRNPFFADLVKGAQARAREFGYMLFVADTDDDPREESRMVRTVSDRVDGALLCTPRTDAEHLDVLTGLAPTVLLHRTSDTTAYVISDVADGVAQAVANLTALGHRRIGYVDGPPESWSAALRRQAIAKAGERAGIEITTVAQVAARFDGGVVAGDLAIASGVTAVLAFNDIVAFGLMHRLSDRGIAVPEDISIIGFDDVAEARMSTPALTTVAQPLNLSGRRGVEMLVDLLAGRELSERALVLPAHLVVRETTAVPRPEARR
ncbi:MULTISPECIES: LacI family DNA-binding transcriptional regulator [Kribbella]|uniref:LacI family DNA-binding transcriptional regulator n=1 Tax=Kribbella karoonensis TaxID=324851 RepID=A0ABP4PY03_9ACTN